MGTALSSAALVAFATRRYARRLGRRTVLHGRLRIDRFKLTRKLFAIDQVLALPEVAAAVRKHTADKVRDSRLNEAESWQRVKVYLDEIVPFLNILAYYRLGNWVSRALSGLFYKVSVEYERPDPCRELPRDSIVILLVNHRSNADYVLVAYVMMGAVCISYAVGEWAWAFPLEYLFNIWFVFRPATFP